MRFLKIYCIFFATLFAINFRVCAQLAPSGYTSAINTPISNVLPLGSMTISNSNNIPEVVRAYPGVGSFGSTNMGFGALPGLEVVGRLTYDGDTFCNQYKSGCLSTSRDLSAGAKYQLPVEFPFGTKISFGGVDLLGSAKNYTETYLVASSQLNQFDFSLGLAKGSLPESLLHGGFASTTFHLNKYLKLIAETDSKETRTGFGLHTSMASDLDLQLLLSKKISHSDPTQIYQVSFGLNYFFDKQLVTLSDNKKNSISDVISEQTLTPNNALKTTQAIDYSTNQNNLVNSNNGSATNILKNQSNLNQNELTEISERIAKVLSEHGFGEISIGSTGDGNWRIRAEPVGWRKNQLDGVGVIFGLFLKEITSKNSTITVTLTYLKQPTVTAVSSVHCLTEFRVGNNYCEGHESIQLYQGKYNVQLQNEDWLITKYGPTIFHPEIELKPVINYVIGSEYGLYNYSLGLNTGWEVPIAKGLLWNASYISPISSSSEYANEQGAFNNSRVLQGLSANQISYNNEVFKKTWFELTVGKLNSSDFGEQIEGDWMSDNGRLRLQIISGKYDSNNINYTHHPELMSARYSIVPGLWSLELVGGQFYNNDKGYQFNSNHWFQDYRLSFYYRDSGRSIMMPSRQYAGFQISFPLGTKESYQNGWLNLRGGDHTSLNLETVIHQGPNYITGGYGNQPIKQHGLYRDILDFDRSGLDDQRQNISRIRYAMDQVN